MRLRHSNEFSDVPVIDVAPLVAHGSAFTPRSRLEPPAGSPASSMSSIMALTNRCVERLEALSREFFAQSEPEKMQIAMSRGGRAWRGYFPVGRELTSGKPDRKEGLTSVRSCRRSSCRTGGTPLHGPNLFPAIPGFRETVLRYLDSLTGSAMR